MMENPSGMTHETPAGERTRPRGPSRIKRACKIGLPILISLVLVAWILHAMEDPEAVWESLKTASPAPLIAIIPLSLLSHFIRGWRWRRFIGQPVSAFYAFTSVMIGYAVNDVLPRVGELARVINMNRLTRVPVARLLTTLLAERILDVIVLALLLGLSFVLEGERIARKFPALAGAGPKAMAAALAALAGLFVLAFAADFLRRFFGRLVRRFHEGLASKVEALIRQGGEGLAFLKRPGQAIPILFETLGIWLLYWYTFILGLAAFGLMDEIGYRGGTVAFSVTCSSVLVPAMGAIGAYHAFGIECLTGFFDIDESRAYACIFAIHALLFYVVGGLFGVLAWALQGWMHGRAPAIEEER
jgi:uncharacterized protein (TIRG00374 family)